MLVRTQERYGSIGQEESSFNISLWIVSGYRLAIKRTYAGEFIHDIDQSMHEVKTVMNRERKVFFLYLTKGRCNVIVEPTRELFDRHI